MMGESSAEVILVVGDTTRFVTTVESLDLPYPVRTARTQSSGLASLDESVGIVLVEEHLPDGDGMALLRAAAERGLRVRTAVRPAGGGRTVEGVDMTLSAHPTKRELGDAIERLGSLRAYDAEVGRFYELSKARSRSGERGAVGDGGFEHMGETVRDARDAADAAMAHIERVDYGRLLGGPAATDEDQ